MKSTEIYHKAMLILCQSETTFTRNFKLMCLCVYKINQYEVTWISVNFSITYFVKNFTYFAFKPTIMEILRHHNFLCKR